MTIYIQIRSLLPEFWIFTERYFYITYSLEYANSDIHSLFVDIKQKSNLWVDFVTSELPRCEQRIENRMSLTFLGTTTSNQHQRRQQWFYPQFTLNSVRLDRKRSVMRLRIQSAAEGAIIVWSSVYEEVLSSTCPVSVVESSRRISQLRSRCRTSRNDKGVHNEALPFWVSTKITPENIIGTLHI